MNDREMLQLCLAAFMAVPTADGSRRFMKQHGMPTGVVYGGTASYKLAVEMKRRLREHLGLLEEQKL